MRTAELDWINRLYLCHGAIEFICFNLIRHDNGTTYKLRIIVFDTFKWKGRHKRRNVIPFSSKTNLMEIRNEKEQV